jgi:hypothetical protein
MTWRTVSTWSAIRKGVHRQEIQLLLARPGFVVGAADRDAHPLEGGHDLVPRSASRFVPDAEVAGRVGRRSLGPLGKEVILEFDRGHEVEAGRAGAGNGAFEDGPRVAGKGLSIPAVDRARQACPVTAADLGIEDQGGGIGHQEQVEFDLAQTAGDRRTVEPVPVVEDRRQQIDRAGSSPGRRRRCR